MVSLIKEKIHFVPFQILLDYINAENIAKLKLAYVVGFNFFLFNDTKANSFGIIK